MDISEFIMKMFTIGFLIAGILGMTIQSISFTGQLRTYENQRVGIDFANAAAASPCLAETIDGDVRKGIIDAGKFANAKNNFCLKYSKPFRIIVIKNGNEIFSTGTLAGGGGLKNPIPVLIKDGETYSNGALNVFLG